MTHFLLRRDRDGNLSVHSASTWGSRKEAMDELTQLLAAPDFDDWDSEYFVLDLDTATPILFVKPAVPAATEPLSTEAVEATVEVDVVSEVVPDVAEALSDPEPADELASDEPEIAAIDESEQAADESEPGISEEPEPVVADEPEPIADVDPTTDEFASEPEEVLPEFDPAEEALLADLRADFGSPLAPVVDAEHDATEPVPDLAIEAPVLGLEPDDLSEPLPEEAGADFLLEPLVELTPDVESAIEPMPVEEAVFVAEPDFGPAPLSAVEAAQPEAFSVPVAVMEDSYEQDIALIADNLSEPELQPLESMEPETSEAEVVFLMPQTAQDVAAEDVVSDVFSLDAPVMPIESESAEAEWPWATDAESADVAVEPEVTTVHPNPLLAARVSIEDLNAGEPVSEPEELEAAQAVDEGDSIADFISDLQEIPEEASAEAEPQGYRSTGNAVADMTCQDCIYLDTCPNSNERVPASCGSFQWK